MTGSNLIVTAPWIVFVVALAIVCFLVLRSGRASRAGPGAAGPAEARDQQPRRQPRFGRPRQHRNRPARASAGQAREDNRARAGTGGHGGERRTGDSPGHGPVDGIRLEARDGSAGGGEGERAGEGRDQGHHLADRDGAASA